jgi:hypothetical protein
MTLSDPTGHAWWNNWHYFVSSAERTLTIAESTTLQVWSPQAAISKLTAVVNTVVSTTVSNVVQEASALAGGVSEAYSVVSGVAAAKKESK